VNILKKLKIKKKSQSDTWQTLFIIVVNDLNGVRKKKLN